MPSFQQVSNGFFRGSRNSVKPKPAVSTTTTTTFRSSSQVAPSASENVKSLLDDPVVSEVAKELSKIPKNDLAALLDRTILPRIQVKIVFFCWFPAQGVTKESDNTQTGKPFLS